MEAKKKWIALASGTVVLAALGAVVGWVQLSPGLVVDGEELLTTPVGGLENTDATSEIVPAQGQAFDKALKVVLRKSTAETNATQLTLMNFSGVEKGDVCLARFWIRGISLDGKSAARMEFLFERATDPWTKSVSSPATGYSNPNKWRQVLIAFQSAETYARGEAMVSLRLAQQPQTILIGGLEVLNYRKSRSLDTLSQSLIAQNRLGDQNVSLDFSKTRQTMMGFGGNFCQPRYGHTDAMDAVGQYCLDNLQVVHARIGIPLNYWNPEPGVYKDEAQAKAALEAMRIMTRRGIPIVGSVWEAPGWILGGRPEQSGRVIPEDKVDACIDSVAQFLLTAQNKYGAKVELFSFNEPDYGVNVKFDPKQMGDFIRKAGKRFRELGVQTKFVVGDTANGHNSYAYAKPLLDDPTLAPYLGPIGFHCWDALYASEDAYRKIAELGRTYKKPVWCLEAGHDAQLWQTPDPWGTWENAVRTAMAYERALRLTEATLMDYWTYQDNYPLTSKDGTKPFPVFHVVKQMEDVFTKGSKVVVPSRLPEDLRVLATSGPSKGQFGVLLVNPIGAGSTVVSGLPRNAPVVLTTSTGDKQNQIRNAKTDGQGRLKVALPMRSVVTLLSGK